jgi:polyhydroxyalkanoate synthesis regulator phasin
MTFSAMTQARAEAFIRDLVKQGEVQAEQAQATIDELVERSRRNSERWIEAIRSEIDQQVANLNLATRDDIERAVQRFADTAAAVFHQMLPERWPGQAASPSAPARPATATGTAKKSAAKATGTAKKSTGAAKKSTAAAKQATGSAKTAAAKKSTGAAKQAAGSAKKATGTAKKATGSARKTAAKKTAAKKTSAAKRATGSAKKAPAKKASGSAKKAPAKKAGGSAG